MMPEKVDVTKASLYIPKALQGERIVERLMAVGKRQKRSVNYLVCQAIVEFLEREEGKA
ncbi:MAG: hypothetical protein WC565_09720 [Parcubacteria group bacterium]